MKTDELLGFLKTTRLKGNGKNNTAINLIYGFDFFLKILGLMRCVFTNRRNNGTKYNSDQLEKIDPYCMGKEKTSLAKFEH